MQNAPLNALRTFEAVARLGSFASAASALCVTQSAVSHQVRNLEDWLGTALLQREGNRTRLLPQGAELAASLGKSLREIDAACQRIRAAPTALVVAAIPSVAMCWLIPRLAQFSKAHPAIQTRVVYAMHGQDIDFRDVHLAFVFAPHPPDLPQISAQFFLSGVSAPVCSPALLPRLGPPPWTDRQILQLGLLHDADARGWRTWTQSGDAPLADCVAGPTFEDFNLLRVAALTGQGAALCPLAMVQADLDNGSLVQLSQRSIHLGADYYLLCAQTAPPQIQQQAQVFLNWALAAAQP